MSIQENVERMKEEAFHNGKDLSILVESFADEVFWMNIIRRFLPDLELDFPYHSPQGAAGKSEIMKYEVLACKDFIICRDSDSEQFFEPDAAWLTNEYIFHTGVYSWESYNCDCNGLNQAIKEVTLRDRSIEDYLHDLSNRLISVFCLWIYGNKYANNDIKNALTVEAWRELIDFRECKELEELDAEIPEMIDRINIKLDNIKTNMGEEWFDAAIQEVQDDLTILPKNIYLYLNGHIIFEQVVSPIYQIICKDAVKNHQDEIRASLSNAKPDVIENRVAEYTNFSAQQDLETKLNNVYKNCINWPDLDELPYLQEVSKKLVASLAN